MMKISINYSPNSVKKQTNEAQSHCSVNYNVYCVSAYPVILLTVKSYNRTLVPTQNTSQHLYPHAANTVAMYEQRVTLHTSVKLVY